MPKHEGERRTERATGTGFTSAGEEQTRWTKIRRKEILHQMLGLLMVLLAVRTVFVNMMCAVTILSTDPTVEQDVEVDPNEDQSSLSSTEVQSTSRKRHRTSRDALELLSETVKGSSKTLIKASENMRKSFAGAHRDSSHVKVEEELYTELLKVEGLTIDEINKAHVRIAGSRSLMIAFPSIPDEHKAGCVRTLIKLLV